jgi:hypothetical protein
MPFEIAFLGVARGVGGRAVPNVIDYCSGVTNGMAAAAAVAGPGTCHDAAPGLGIKNYPSRVLRLPHRGLDLV